MDPKLRSELEILRSTVRGAVETGRNCPNIYDDAERMAVTVLDMVRAATVELAQTLYDIAGELEKGDQPGRNFRGATMLDPEKEIVALLLAIRNGRRERDELVRYADRAKGDPVPAAKETDCGHLQVYQRGGECAICREGESKILGG